VAIDNGGRPVDFCRHRARQRSAPPSSNGRVPSAGSPRFSQFTRSAMHNGPRVSADGSLTRGECRHRRSAIPGCGSRHRQRHPRRRLRFCLPGNHQMGQPAGDSGQPVGESGGAGFPPGSPSRVERDTG
jgi:hypothetical protein